MRIECAFGVSCFFFCWMGGSWNLTVFSSLAGCTAATPTPPPHDLIRKSWEMAKLREEAGPGVSGSLLPSSLPCTYMGPISERQPFVFQFVSLRLGCGASVLEDLIVFCQVTGTCRPVMEHPGLDISLGAEPSSSRIFHLSLGTIHLLWNIPDSSWWSQREPRKHDVLESVILLSFPTLS